MWFFKKIWAALLALFFIIVSFYIFFQYIYTKSLSNDFIEIDLKTPIERIEVLIDKTSGVNHIQAQNRKDAYFMLGYIHARDRLFQMDLKRRLINGDLSEVLSKQYLHIDLLFRTLGMKEIINLAVKNLDKESLDILNNYSQGVNEFIENNSSSLSFGFIMNDYNPKNWRVEDCIAVFKLWALENSIGFKIDLILANIAQRIGIKRTSDLLNIGNRIEIDSSITSNNREITINQISKSLALLEDSLGYFPSVSACNSWALNKDSKNAHHTILANDIHSNVKIPSTWYQTAISYGENDIAGVTLPGFPFVVIGRNNFIAWGITNSMIDDFDYSIEKTFKDKFVITENDSITINNFKDTINILNDEPYQFYKQTFKNKSIIQGSSDYINDFEVLNIEKNNNSKGSTILSFNWIGKLESNESYSLLRISESKNYSEFSNALMQWGSPNLQFSFADKHGDFALINAGCIPKRKAGIISSIPLPGWKSENDWLFDQMKPGINYTTKTPESGYVYSANSEISKDSLSNYFDLPFRAFRINELLQQYLEVDDYVYQAFDAQRMQMDVVSIFAKQVIKKIYPIFKSNLSRLSKKELYYFKKVKNWDCILSIDSEEAAIFKLWLNEIILATFADELGIINLKKIMNYPHFLHGKLIGILDNAYSKWFDNIKTTKTESRATIILNSYRNTLNRVEKLKTENNISKLSYSDFQKLSMSSYFNQTKIAASVFNSNPIFLGGDNYTINRSTSFYSNISAVNVAPTLRMVVDLSNDAILFSIPGGVSSEPMSSFYVNQLHLWENGGYIEFHLKNKDENTEKLISCY